MYYSLINSMNRAVVSSYTARTTAFATATGITDTTILGALNTFDLGLISNSLDTKMKALYPLVGGTSSTHKYNFMDARDLDAAYRLSFSGGFTHSSNGVLPNGVNATGDTFLNTNTKLTGSSHSFGVYSRTESLTGAYGTWDSGSNFLQQNFGSNFCSGNSSSNIIFYTPSPSKRLMLGSRTSTTLFTAYRDGVSLGTATGTFTNLPSVDFTFFSRGANLYNLNELAFAFLGDGLNSTEVTSFNTLVNNLQTSLSRNV
jgi:hypothetical protein